MREIKRPQGWEMKDIFEKVKLNEYGYYQLRQIDSEEERQKMFQESYFQEYDGSTYAKEYEEDELHYLRTQLGEKALVIEENLKKTGAYADGRYSLLDVGCGEGFLLKFFREKGVQVKGIDFGRYAIEKHNPDMLDAFVQGNMSELLPEMAKQGEKYDVINVDRVLDMVVDPAASLQQMRLLMDKNSILLIKVANNYSYLQQMLLRSGEVKEEYWLDDPGHTGYFNREGLIALAQAQGYECMDFFADTFVDFHLLNPLTNYYEKPETGKSSHKATVRLENLLYEISPERMLEIARNLSEMGFGREIIGVFRLR